MIFIYIFILFCLFCFVCAPSVLVYFFNFCRENAVALYYDVDETILVDHQGCVTHNGNLCDVIRLSAQISLCNRTFLAGGKFSCPGVPVTIKTKILDSKRGLT